MQKLNLGTHKFLCIIHLVISQIEEQTKRFELKVLCANAFSSFINHIVTIAEVVDFFSSSLEGIIK